MPNRRRNSQGAGGKAADASATASTCAAESSCLSKERGFGAFQKPAGHVARDGREALQKFFERVVGFEVIKERLDRNARALEDRGALFGETGVLSMGIKYWACARPK